MAAIFNLQDNDVEYMYCFIAFLDSENGLSGLYWWNNRLSIINDDIITSVI